MRAPEPAVPAFRTIAAQPDVVFAEEEPPALELAPEPSPIHVVEEPQALVPEEPQPLVSAGVDTPLMSSATSAAVDSAFTSLAHTVLAQNARTLDDLVKEMLRPMLKSWLDDNLPGLVERLVRAEIERVSRGR